MSLTAVRAGAYLHHIAFQSADPEQLAKFYANAMDMTVKQIDESTWHCSGPQRHFLAVKGESKQLAYAGLACRDQDGVDELKARAEKEGLTVHPAQGDFFLPRSFAVEDPDGNMIGFGVAKENSSVSTANGKADNPTYGPLQHLTFATDDVQAFEDFYHGKLGFAVSDRVMRNDKEMTTCFLRSNHEHHTIACFKSNRQGVDHHSYEAGQWDIIRDWSDRFASQDIQLMWGPGRHGPGNNLFIFIEDPDGNWIEVSAELEVIHDRPVVHWPHDPRTLNRWGEAIMRS